MAQWPRLRSPAKFREGRWPKKGGTPPPPPPWNPLEMNTEQKRHASTQSVGATNMRAYTAKTSLLQRITLLNTLSLLLKFHLTL